MPSVDVCRWSMLSLWAGRACATGGLLRSSDLLTGNDLSANYHCRTASDLRSCLWHAVNQRTGAWSSQLTEIRRVAIDFGGLEVQGYVFT